MKLRAFLPLVTFPDPHRDTAVAAGAAVARHLGAALHGVSFEADIPSVSTALSRFLIDLPQLVLEAEKLSAHRGKDLLAAVATQAGGGLEVSGEIANVQLALLGDAAAAHARYFDLTLLGWEAGNAGVRMIAEACLFASGRPLVLLPAEASIDAVFDHVAVAWDGSRVAARALADARPFLERASRISVVTVTSEKALEDATAGEKLVARLRSSGSMAELVAADIDGRPIGTALQDIALSRGAGLLVMGGYGHSRLRDFVLGGATADVIGAPAMPLLLSH